MGWPRNKLQSLESNQKRSNSMRGKKPWNTGKTLSPEHKDKISVSETGKPKPGSGWSKGLSTKNNPSLALKGRNTSKALIGRKLSQEHKQHLSESHKGEVRSLEYKAKMSQVLKGRKALWLKGSKWLFSPEVREKAVTSIRKRAQDPEYRAKLSIATKKFFNTPESREKRRQEIWGDPIRKEKHLRAIARGAVHRPNKPEICLGEILDSNYPDEYEYNGNGRKIVAECIPDFVGRNGRKEVIEMFGDYWHRGENSQTKISKYAKVGFRCLVIWEHELRDISTVLQRLRSFRESL